MLDKIIESVRFVGDNSKYVKINEERLNEFVNNIDNIEMKHWTIFNALHLKRYNNAWNIIQIEIDNNSMAAILLYTEGSAWKIVFSPVERPREFKETVA